jgi:hypothetical protein
MVRREAAEVYNAGGVGLKLSVCTDVDVVLLDDVAGRCGRAQCQEAQHRAHLGH